MASASIQNSPSPPWIWKYDVFLSFRGDDTRFNFTDHLFAALQRKAVVTFKDDGKLKKGKIISKELLKAIEESQICIVVLSKDYAGSTWCLEELANIIDCNERVDRNQTILPVFYDVDPSEVRQQSGSYGQAFARHKKRSPKKVQRWRNALSKVAEIAGWDAQNKPESQVIEGIVKEITNVLDHKFSSLADELVGIQSRLEILYKHTALDLNDVRYIGIVGMGGIGKTTLATVLYDRICHRFDASSLLENVKERSKGDGLIKLQKQLLCETLQEENIKVGSLYTGTNLLSTRLRNTKTLIVLDDVEESYQLEKLVGKLEWFGAGSRIIITTRDEHIPRQYGVDHVYKAELLDTVEDLQFFCRKAFKCDYPLKGFKELTHRVLEYAKGLPLAIKVLGSFLYGRSVSEWESALVRLKKNPNREIIDVLRTSFDGLEPTEKEIFLDIACFFGERPERVVKEILDLRGFHPDIGMRILIDRSLINIVDGTVRMHDLLKELGRKIVKEKSLNEPGKWSRLWCYEDLCQIMTRNSATKDIEALVLPRPHSEEMELRAETLSEMSGLRILRLDGVKVAGNLSGLSKEIQYFAWVNYPYAYLPHPFPHSPSMFQDCSSKQLWEGIKPFNNLVALGIVDSEKLVKTPDFRGMPNLKWLSLSGCTSLTHIDESIGVLSKLKSLVLEKCRSLVSLPSSIVHLTSLQILNLAYCSKLKSMFEETSDAKCLGEFKSLQALTLSYCNLEKLPDSFERMRSLKYLDLEGNNFVTLPSTINKLSRLTCLNLGECNELQCLPELPLAPNDNSPAYFQSGLYIFNCPKLAENKIETFIKLALSWLTKLIQEPCHPKEGIDMMIPGDDVPEWFNHQSLGCSTRVQLPLSRDWIGVALCAALVPNGYDNIDFTNYYYTSFTVELCPGKKTTGIPTCYSVMRKLVSVKSDHLWLFYLPREMSICTTLLTWQVGDDIQFRAAVKYIKVMKCGVRWVYKQDIQELELLNAAMNNS